MEFFLLCAVSIYVTDPFFFFSLLFHRAGQNNP